MKDFRFPLNFTLKIYRPFLFVKIKKGGMIMKRMGFERPTDYYDERLYTIDEKNLCPIKRTKRTFRW